MAPHAWWLPETEGKAPNLYGIWDINVNQLIPTGFNHPVTGYGGAPTKTMLCKIYPLGENDAIPTENTKCDKLDFSDFYDIVPAEDMASPEYRGDRPTEFADSRSWDIPENTPVYSFKDPSAVADKEVKHMPLEEILKENREFKAKFGKESARE